MKRFQMMGTSISGMGTCLIKWPMLFLALAWLGVGTALAYDNEVWEEDGLYCWKVNDGQQGSSADLSSAITRCLSDSTGPGREIHILTGGDLSATIGIPSDVSLYGHTNTFNVIHGDYTIHAKGVDHIGFYDMSITGASHMVFRITACDDVVLSGIHIDGGFIGMRVDSRDSRAWLAWSYNLTVTNCTFENLGGHGLETYGIDGCVVDNIVARNNGECGVLLNRTINARVGTVDAYRCCYGGGYAGLRFANGCENVTVEYVKSIECGRGFFVTTGGKNIVVEEAYIRDCSAHAILLQYSDEVGINSGSYNGDANLHYTSVNLWNLASDVDDVTASPPAAASRPSASVDEDRVFLKWPAVSGAASYRLQRAPAAVGPFFTVACTETTEFVDRDIFAGSNYYYRVRAVNAAGPGKASPEASVAIAGAMSSVVDLESRPSEALCVRRFLRRQPGRFCGRCFRNGEVHGRLAGPIAFL